MPAVNIDSITREAKTYDNVLRTLPYFSLDSICTDLKLNLLQVDNEHVVVNSRRKAGNTGPYKQGNGATETTEIGKFFETTLKPELTICKLKDNILNYTEKKVLSNAGETVDHKTKKHPLEREILDSVVKSHSEDIVFSLFFAERDADTFSPLSAFTGIYPKIDAYITSGDISTGNGNLYNTGHIINPIDKTDTDAYYQLVDFIGSAHKMLLSERYGVTQLICSQDILTDAKNALGNIVNTFEKTTYAKLLEYLREDTRCSNLIFSSHPAIGFGSRMVLQKIGNIDIGFNTGKTSQFVQVRSIYEDPYELQFWLSAAYGTRLKDIHSKLFLTNEQVNTALDLSGDYGNLGSSTVTLSPEAAVNAGAMWRLENSSFWKRSGQSAINLPEGTYNVIYKDVAGYTTPASASVEVTGGSDKAVSGKYTVAQ